jgi:hypothetical protein
VWQGTLPTFSSAANVTQLATASANILASDDMSTDSTKVIQDPNVNMAAITLHDILPKTRKIMPQSTIMSITDRPARCTLQNIIPLNAIKSKTSKIRY